MGELSTQKMPNECGFSDTQQIKNTQGEKGIQNVFVIENGFLEGTVFKIRHPRTGRNRVWHSERDRA